MSITFSSCFYIINSKFDPNIYIEWMKNFISIVNNFNLVIYTDENTFKYINTINNIDNPKIKIVIKPIQEFYNYKYKDFWIENHKKNYLLKDISCWELNMLWSEKIWFVKETIERKYFDTEFYGWCDIGYFRNRDNDTPICELVNWGNNQDVLQIVEKNNKICYGCINNNNIYFGSFPLQMIFFQTITYLIPNMIYYLIKNCCCDFLSNFLYICNYKNLQMVSK